MDDNTTTLTWLIIIALSSVTQTVVLVGTLMVVNRRLRAAEERMRAIERVYIAPALARMELALQDVQDVAARLRRADDAVRSWAEHTADGVDAAMGLVWSKARPVVGLVKGVRAAARAWRNGAQRAERGERERTDPNGPNGTRA